MTRHFIEYLLCYNGDYLESHGTLASAVKAWSIVWMHNRKNGYNTNFTIRVISI